MSEELFIEDNELDSVKIFSLFKSAFFDTELSEDGDIIIDGWPVATLSVDKERFMIRFFIWFETKKSSDELLLRFVNKANFEKIMVRFTIDNAMSDKSAACADYYLSFKGGLTAYQIVDSYRKFHSIAKDSFSNKEFRDFIADKKI
jgi:hypothetical protein